MRIKKLQISGIGPIGELNLNFNSGFNIICGKNGVGKTTILDCIGQSFTVNNTSLKRNVQYPKGSWSVEIDNDGLQVSRSFSIDQVNPDTMKLGAFGLYELSTDVIVFKTHRDIQYQKVASINSDPQKDFNNFATEALSGSIPHDMKNWFVNRHMWSKHENHLSQEQLKNIELAKKCFGILDPQISFNKVLPDTNDIMVMTPKGELYYEYLSSGFKSTLSILIGLVKEIEFRFKTPTKFASDFSGIILIDEIDLHLHPQWQAKIYEAMKILFPLAQIITSTHSPHLLQIASANEIISLVEGSDGKITSTDLTNHPFGFQGWTVEEILTQIMGMQEVRSQRYRIEIEQFSQSIENGDQGKAIEAFSVLEQLLHPDNVLRKILKLQLAGVGND